MKGKCIVSYFICLLLIFGFSARATAAVSADQSPPKLQTRPAPSRNVPVVTPDLPKLPWTMENGVKVFHLSADVVRREILPASPMAPAKVLTLWGYNGSVPGPTIEVNEGDRVRIIFKNNLPEDTTVHWHGLEIPIEMDGMPFISQPPVKPGGTFVYEFTLHQNGTYFYHSHGAMQEMMGMIGFFVIHPKHAYAPACQRDFGLVLQEFAVLPNNPIANSMSMEFNWLTLNGKAAPATTPMIVRQGDRVRIRLINMGMDHHPIHIHGTQFYVTGTEGGRIPQSAWYPGNTVIVGVAQARDIEFDAIHPGDWMLHCHLPHHMMNNMSSMVGPMTHVGHGLHTGMGMQEGMGIVREGAATSENLGPGIGRGMGITADRERALGNGTIGGADSAQMQQLQGTPGALSAAEEHARVHNEVNQNGAMAGTGTVPTTAPEMDMQGMPGMEGMSGMSGTQGMQKPQAPSSTSAATQSQTLPPAYPQDAMMMMMPMDAAVAKPENNYLAPNWSAALQGMMSLIRILPAAQYDRLVADIRAGRTVQPGGMQMDHGKMNMPMDNSKMNMPMDHGKMNMPMDNSKMNMPMDHDKMNMPMDHDKMNMPMDHGKMNMPMDHGKMNMPMDHGKMNMPMDHGKMNMPMDHGKMNTKAKSAIASKKRKRKQSVKPAIDHSKMDMPMNMPGMDHSKMKM